MTQAQRLVESIRAHKSHGKGWPTYGDLLATRISVCPWKRLEESAHKWLKPHEQIVRKTNGNGLTVFAIARATRLTA